MLGWVLQNVAVWGIECIANRNDQVFYALELGWAKHQLTDGSKSLTASICASRTEMAATPFMGTVSPYTSTFNTSSMPVSNRVHPPFQYPGHPICALFYQCNWAHNNPSDLVMRCSHPYAVLRFGSFAVNIMSTYLLIFNCPIFAMSSEPDF